MIERDAPENHDSNTIAIQTPGFPVIELNFLEIGVDSEANERRSIDRGGWGARSPGIDYNRW